MVAGFPFPRPQPQQPGGEDLADLGQALGGGHQVGVEGVVHCSARKAVVDRRVRHRLLEAVIATLGGQQLLSIVNDYSLILTSRKAEARRFKRWVTHEVLPALRRRGVYDMRAVEPIDQLAPYLHDHQLRVLHALEAATDETSLVTVGRLPMITGLSIEKIRRTLHLFEVLRVIWWETPDFVRLRRRHLPWAYRSTPPPAVSPKSPWLETQR